MIAHLHIKIVKLFEFVFNLFFFQIDNTNYITLLTFSMNGFWNIDLSYQKKHFFFFYAFIFKKLSLAAMSEKLRLNQLIHGESSKFYRKKIF